MNTAWWFDVLGNSTLQNPEFTIRAVWTSCKKPTSNSVNMLYLGAVLKAPFCHTPAYSLLAPSGMHIAEKKGLLTILDAPRKAKRYG